MQHIIGDWPLKKNLLSVYANARSDTTFVVHHLKRIPSAVSLSYSPGYLTVLEGMQDGLFYMLDQNEAHFSIA